MVTHSVTRSQLISAAKKSLKSAGYDFIRLPGRGLSNVWRATKDGKSQTVAVRTTRDRWIAFPPLSGGTTWKTLADVDAVLVAAVNDRDEPTGVDVYLLPAENVRKRFDEAYAARTADGQVNEDGYGMWVNLDPDTRGIAASVGSGIIKAYPAFANYSLHDLGASSDEEQAEYEENDAPANEIISFKTVSEVLSWAREQIATISSIPASAIRLELKIEL